MTEQEDPLFSVDALIGKILGFFASVGLLAVIVLTAGIWGYLS